MSCKPFVVATFAVMLSLAGLAHAQDSGPYKIIKIQLLGGDGGFDYVTATPMAAIFMSPALGPPGTSASITSIR